MQNTLWQLTPIDSDDLNWDASTYCGKAVIRAPSESRARGLANSKFRNAARRGSPGQQVTTPPWEMVSMVACERLVGSEYEEEGREAILFPEGYDRE